MSKKITLALFALALTTGAASAQYYPQPNPYTTYTPPAYSPPVTYNRLGSTIMGSDGTTINRLGSSDIINTPGQPTRTCQQLGSSYICQ